MNPQFKDEEIILQIDSLSLEELKYYSDHYIVNNLNHYMKLQIEWLEKEKYYLGIKLRHNPNNEELINFWVKHHNSERFRAFYVLKYPDKVRFI